MSHHTNRYELLHNLFLGFYLQLMFSQSVIVRGFGFPLFATYVALTKAAWRAVTASLSGQYIGMDFNTNTQQWIKYELMLSYRPQKVTLGQILSTDREQTPRC